MAATLLTKSCTKVVALFQVSLGFLVLACLVAPLFAQDTFTAGSGLWSQPNNWSLNRLPTSSDDC